MGEDSGAESANGTGVQYFNASVHAVVAVTDKRWSDFLRERSHLTEANVWTPSSVGFLALKTGEPVLFKTHGPHNRLVGGGSSQRVRDPAGQRGLALLRGGDGRATEAQVLEDVNGHRYRCERSRIPLRGCRSDAGTRHPSSERWGDAPMGGTNGRELNPRPLRG